jgi:hypothetical protein
MKKTLKYSSLAVGIVGVFFILSGSFGLYFTYQSVAMESIVTPVDATIPNAEVRGPLTLKAQADIIRSHTLANTKGLTYAQMSRFVPKMDEQGSTVLDQEGKPIMENNPARSSWISATALITALNLGILAYAVSALVITLGTILVGLGFLGNKLSCLIER